MKIHGLVALLVSSMFHEPRPLAFNLYATSGFLLDVLYVCTSMSYNLGTEIETGKRLKIDRDALLGPFALPKLANIQAYQGCISIYTSKLVSFELFRFPATEPPFID